MCDLCIMVCFLTADPLDQNDFTFSFKIMVRDWKFGFVEGGEPAAYGPNAAPMVIPYDLHQNFHCQVRTQHHVKMKLHDKNTHKQ